jgi:hypothetical protein
MVTYTGLTSAVDTNNWDGGLHALTMQVNQVAKLTADGWFKDLEEWRALQLWRVGGNGTMEQYLEDGPFTRISEKGRVEPGNYVVIIKCYTGLIGLFYSP